MLRELNEHSVLPFPLGMPADELSSTDGYERTEGFGCYGLEKGGVFVTVSGWPDVVDAYHVTEIRICDASYSVFGAAPGDDLAQAEDAFLARGYQLDSTSFTQSYVKEDVVRIRLRFDGDGRIDQIIVQAVTTNKGEAVF